jgi:hypothetical protein
MAGMPRTRAVGGAGYERAFLPCGEQIFIEPLRCENCDGNAHLTRRSPHGLEGLEIRVFACHECAHQIERIVSLATRVP